MTTLTFQPRELADMYALKTLYEYVADSSKFDFEFLSSCWNEKAPANVQIVQDETQFMNAVRVYSDIRSYARTKNAVEIDISVLKSAAPAYTAAEKIALRKKLGINSDRPVVVLSYFYARELELHLLHQIKEIAIVYAVGDTTTSDFLKRDFKFRTKQEYPLTALAGYPIFAIETRGNLKDLYAVADASIVSSTMTESSGFMHNFVEATEGGPLFMMRPGRTRQYGYKHLVKSGVIRECSSYEEIVNQLVSFLRGFGGNSGHVAARLEHIQRTREKYLPVLADYLNHIFAGRRAPQSDLVIARAKKNGNKLVRITHPETDWEREMTW